MKILKNKISNMSTIALILILAFSATLMIFLPTVNAVDFDTYAFLSVTPTPIGVDQQAFVTFWLDKVPPLDAGWSVLFENYEVKITNPNGNEETKGPFTSDAVASAWFHYTPDMIGTYTFQFSFPGQTIGERYYKPSTSRTVEIVVQEVPVEPYPNYPIPGPFEYWERPIEAQNRDWGSISGNWLGVPKQFASTYDNKGAFNPYTTAPETAHIVWTKPNHFSGLVGGEFGSGGFYSGLSYEGKFTPPVIIAGILYYNLPLANARTGGGFVAVDLRTGEELWWQEGTIDCGQLLRYDSPNEHGVHAYLWDLGSTSKMYDAFSGTWILDIANTTQQGRAIMDPSGDMIFYRLSGATDTITMWNSTKAIPPPGTSSASAWNWRPPIGAVLDGNEGIEWSVTIPDVPGSPFGWTGHAFNEDVLIASSLIQDVTPPQLMVVGYNPQTGNQMWAFNITTGVVRQYTNFSPVEDGVFAYFKQETTSWTGYDALTGRELWETEPYENAWATYMTSYAGAGPQPPTVAYGNMYVNTYDGRVHCHDMQTGDEIWTYYGGSAGFETPYGTWPFHGAVTVADGKVYATNNEHSPSDPLARGMRLHCIDAYTGEGVWDILTWTIAPAIADGYLVSLNYYDGQIYCFGKGKTAITVDAPLTSINWGDSVVLRGSITDQSPGAEGTPAIADEYMTEWMEYQYMQKPMPTNATGVEVTLDVIDANGNYRTIGTATSDKSGFYSFSWMPDIPGKYTVIANFEGSESYWSSHTETAFDVEGAPTPTPPPEATPAPMTDTYIAGSTIAILAGIAVVAFLILRKK